MDAEKLLDDYEVGEAKLLLELISGEVVYDRATGQWYKWIESQWVVANRDSLLACVDKVIKIYDKLMKGFPTPEIYKALLSRRTSLNTHRRRVNVVKLAEAYWVDSIRWDDFRMTLPVTNGVVSLKTGSLRSYKISDFYHIRIPTEWKGLTEPYPMWDYFLESVFDGNKDLIGYVQRLIGYALLGSCREHIFPILWGSGRNGKGVFINTIQYVLGSIAGAASSSLLLKPTHQRDASSPTPEIMKLKGKRIVWASETGESGKLFTSQVKWLSGGDILTGRGLYGKEMEEFHPTHTLFLMTNHRPQADPDDQALWYRVRLIPFHLSFVNNPEKDNERQIIEGLEEQLKEEGSGILAWMVKGAIDYWKHGLTTPKGVEAATENYREMGDTTNDFIHEELEKSEGSRVKALELYKHYQSWCRIRGLSYVSNTKFGVRVSKIAEKVRYSWGVEYHGIRTKTKTVDLRPSSFDPEDAG